MLDKIKNNYYLLMGISIFCLIVIVFTSSYAYFKTQVRGEGKGMNVILGTIDLDITENSISTNNLLPISDSSKDTKAQIKDFTVKRTSNSDLDVCYNLYLVVDSISSNIKNSKYLKYELTDGSNVVSGNLSKLGYNSDGKGYILLAKNKYLSKSDTIGNTYKLKIWLSYDKSTNQNDLLNSNITTHIYASGNSGNTCPGSVDTIIHTPLYEQILADNPTRNTRDTYDAVFTNNTTGTLFTATEKNVHNIADTTVYYYAGNTTNNWVKFAGYYWRIIRTNADGSVRMLYSGTATNTTSGYLSTGKSAFNTSENSPKYVGYMYGEKDDTLVNARTNTNNSTIKTAIDNWYASNMTSYTKYLSTTAVYCNDRTERTSGTYNTGSTNFDYAPYARATTSHVPTYDCTETSDAFSVDNTSAKLTYPIALMTSDEIMRAGGKYITGLTSPYSWYYLNSANGSITGSTWWWLLSPYFWHGGHASVFSVDGSSNPGFLNNLYVDSTVAVRPAISLKSCVKTSGGDGTSSNPYTIQETSSGC